MIQQFAEKIQGISLALNKRGIGFAHYFLDDGAIHLPESFPTLVRHLKNQGLAPTLMDGYRAVLQLKTPAEIIIRLDCQEHDPYKILEIVDNMGHSPVDAMFLPVYYWVSGENRPLMKEVSRRIAEFNEGLAPISKTTVLATYNQVFPLGFQAFRQETLQILIPKLERGMELCEKITGKPATWGLDLLVILIAANDGMITDSMFGGWSEPWKENRGTDKVEAQRVKAETMVEVAHRLGYQIRASATECSSD